MALFLNNQNLDANYLRPKVIAAFMTTAYFTAIIIIAYYIMNCVPQENLNVLDHGVLKFLQKTQTAVSWTKSSDTHGPSQEHD